MGRRITRKNLGKSISKLEVTSQQIDALRKQLFVNDLPVPFYTIEIHRNIFSNTKQSYLSMH